MSLVMASLHLGKYIIVALVIHEMIIQLMAREIPDAVSMMERHEQWIAHYRREYRNAVEKEQRYWIFKANLEYIDSVNAAGKAYKLSVNQFADITNEEFRKTHLAYRNPFQSSPATTPFRYANFTAAPPSIDWRKKGAVTPIRDEICGGWTFPAVDSVEGITKIKGGKLHTLSVQEIVDCYGGGDDGCNGGLVSGSEAFDFIKEHGLTTKSNYLPENKTGTCNVKKEAEPVAKISSYQSIPADDEEALMKAVGGQPVAVSVDASSPDFQFYSTGVFTGKCGTTLDHGVTVIGYGTQHGKLKYWIVKNSWGTNWGENGYMRLQKDIDEKEGLCGIAMAALYPVV